MRVVRRPLPAWADIVLLPLVNVTLAFVTVGFIVRIIRFERRGVFDAMRDQMWIQPIVYA